MPGMQARQSAWTQDASQAVGMSPAPRPAPRAGTQGPKQAHPRPHPPPPNRQKPHCRYVFIMSVVQI
jgi:hypothetical protein